MNNDDNTNSDAAATDIAAKYGTPGNPNNFLSMLPNEVLLKILEKFSSLEELNNLSKTDQYLRNVLLGNKDIISKHIKLYQVCATTPKDFANLDSIEQCELLCLAVELGKNDIFVKYYIDAFLIGQDIKKILLSMLKHDNIKNFASLMQDLQKKANSHDLIEPCIDILPHMFDKMGKFKYPELEDIKNNIITALKQYIQGRRFVKTTFRTNNIDIINSAIQHYKTTVFLDSDNKIHLTSLLSNMDEIKDINLNTIRHLCHHADFKYSNSELIKILIENKRFEICHKLMSRDDSFSIQRCNRDIIFKSLIELLKNDTDAVLNKQESLLFAKLADFLVTKMLKTSNFRDTIKYNHIWLDGMREEYFSNLTICHSLQDILDKGVLDASYHMNRKQAEKIKTAIEKSKQTESGMLTMFSSNKRQREDNDTNANKKAKTEAQDSVWNYCRIM